MVFNRNLFGELFLFLEILPLVQFHPEVDINDAEAERLLLAPPKPAEEGDPFSEVQMHIVILKSTTTNINIL